MYVHSWETFSNKGSCSANFASSHFLVFPFPDVYVYIALWRKRRRTWGAGCGKWNMRGGSEGADEKRRAFESHLHCSASVLKRKSALHFLLFSFPTIARLSLFALPPFSARYEEEPRAKGPLPGTGQERGRGEGRGVMRSKLQRQRRTR